MIKTFKHKGLRDFFEHGNKAGIQAAHASRLKRQLVQLNIAAKPLDMNVPGWDFHSLQGKEAGRFTVSVNGNWRMTFEFDGTDAVLVNYVDYH